MAQRLFSETLSEFSGEIKNLALAESISELQKFLRIKKLRLFEWSEHYLAISLKISVDLPPLGNFQNIDIRDHEHVLIVVDINNYPTTAPVVFPDRLDFPKNNLAHLYVAKKGKPPAFCLVREGLTEWYSNKRLKDLYIRVRNWLRDAASGQLSEDGDQFDPVRLEGYSGTMIYDYDQIAKVVNGKESFLENTNFATALFERGILENRVVFRLTKIVTQETLGESLNEFKKEKEKGDSAPSKKNFHFGYIVWSERVESFSQYSVNFPDDWTSFKNFCDDYGIDTSCLETQIAENDHNIFVSIPVIIAIRRPKKLIGFSSDIEFINFTLSVNTNDVANRAITNNVPVLFYKHGQPLSRAKAKQISGLQVDLGKYSLIVGCGALGSKIIMHFARSGATNYVIVDPDDISPHNLVRHALSANSEGLNKADALKKEILALYPNENLALLIASKNSGSSFFDEELLKYFTWILDFTASNSFYQDLIKAEVDSQTRIARAFVTDFGNLGVLYLEGKQRNPRIDDLQIMLYAQYRKLEFISSWLKREKENDAKSNNLSITIGVGCNSETTVLSDDLVSLHSAYISAAIKTESHQEHGEVGKIYLNEIKTDPFFSNIPKLVTIPPMEVYTAINDAAWQIRIKPGIIDTMKKEMGLAMPSETGGVFVGSANYKTKTIHVVELIKAPSDSKANEICFFRGIEGLSQTINEINQSTGNQLGYIGEWHTHPFGPNNLSATDAGTIRRFKKEFNDLQSPLPVFLIIVTPTHVLPYVY